MIRNLFGGATKCRTIDKLDIFGDGSGVALYRLDGNANDESGNYHGTETNVTYGGGVYERGAVFNGTSSYINTGYSFPYTAFSYSLWYKYGSVNKMIISSVSTNPVKAGQFSLTQDSATQLDLEFINNDSGTQTTLLNQTVPNMNDGLFHHIVVTIESGGVMKFYFDASLINTSSAVPTFVNSNTQALNLMREPRNNYYKDGSLDQVRIFNRAITAQEVATLYAECAPTSIVDNINPFEDGSLKALYKFDNDATDATGVYNGTATNVTYTSGKFGNCAVFNGSPSYVDTNSFSNLHFTDFSVSMWIKPTSLVLQGSLIYNNYIQSRISSTGMLWLVGDLNGTTYTKSWVLNTWYHITLVSTATKGKLFVDGIEVQSYTYTKTLSAGTTLRIGRDTLNSFQFNGSIDQVRIFDKALTPLEIASLYNETTPMEEPMSVRVDPFKDGSGKALYRLEGNALDESGNYNGTPTSVTYGAGRFGRCGVFNGSSSKIGCSSKIIDNKTDLSISVWIRKIGNSNYSGIISEGGNAAEAGYVLAVYPDNTTIDFWRSNGSTYVFNNHPYNFGLGDYWTHIAITVTQTELKYYKDGGLAYTASISNTSTVPGYKNTNFMYDSQFGRYMSGSIDQVRMFNRALTQSEVTALYNEI